MNNFIFEIICLGFIYFSIFKLLIYRVIYFQFIFHQKIMYFMLKVIYFNRKKEKDYSNVSGILKISAIIIFPKNKFSFGW